MAFQSKIYYAILKSQYFEELETIFHLFLWERGKNDLRYQLPFLMIFGETIMRSNTKMMISMFGADSTKQVWGVQTIQSCHKLNRAIISLQLKRRREKVPWENISRQRFFTRQRVDCSWKPLTTFVGFAVSNVFDACRKVLERQAPLNGSLFDVPSVTWRT